MKLEFVLRWVLRVGLVIAFIYDLSIGHVVGMLGGGAIFAVTFLLSVINRKKEVIYYTLVAMFYIFCIFAVIGGVMLDFYDYISWWDLLMHLFSGVLLGVTGKWIINIYMPDSKLPSMLVLLLVLGVACIGGVVWEMYEFTIDSLFGLDTQVASTTGVGDTMGDLITDFLGGLIAGIYFGYIKK